MSGRGAGVGCIITADDDNEGNDSQTRPRAPDLALLAPHGESDIFILNCQTRAQLGTHLNFFCQMISLCLQIEFTLHFSPPTPTQTHFQVNL